MNNLIAQFPHREHELHHISPSDSLIEAFGTDYAEGFAAKLDAIADALEDGEKLIVFYLGQPKFTITRDFEGNEHRINLS